MADSHSSSGRVLGAWGAMLLLLGFCGFLEYGPPSDEGSILDEEASSLAPCSVEDSAFESLPFSGWAEYHHTAINGVIKAHLAQIQQSQAQQALQCASSDFSGVLPASAELEQLARTLPPWKPRRTQGGAQVLPPVSASDLVAVTLEQVRIYECALLERQAEGDLAREQSSSSPTGAASSTSAAPRQPFVDELAIRDELATARPALEQTLSLVSGMERLQPLIAELQCLERALADIRNMTGLLAESSACMNRAWDGRGSLRDLVEP